MTKFTVDLKAIEDMRAYQRSLSFVLVKAVKDALDKNVVIQHSLGKGVFCKLEGVNEVTDEMISKIDSEIRKTIDKDFEFEKIVVNKEDAIDMFNEYKMHDKAKLIQYKTTSVVELYRLDWFVDHFDGNVFERTSQLSDYRLVKHADGFIMQIPDIYSGNEMPAEDAIQEKVGKVMEEHEKWGEILEVGTVAELNDKVAAGKTDEIIRVAEILHDQKLSSIAKQIDGRGSVKLVLIAGPSSSGKTTFSKKLSDHLRVLGYRPFPISLDDYFVDRENTPVDEDGKLDFECLEAVDVKLFNEHLTKLLAGEEVEIPTFNFKFGKREFNGHKIKLEENDVLVVEGIHGLNEKLTASIAKENKFKIYISALTQLNLDNHNRIHTTNTRLLRRMVRDNKYRGHGAEKTLEMWASVRKGEEKNIFPHQESADAIFNSSLVYEISVLKQFAEPLFLNIDKDSPYYDKAKSMIEFLDYFQVINTESIPLTSLIREFVGGSIYRD
ncbi:MAG: nucleoside kinase [Clostridia bacterium]|jgi:uridine kinase|nr:nucleoside kinase [Clostridia bacterium]